MEMESVKPKPFDSEYFGKAQSRPRESEADEEKEIPGFFFTGVLRCGVELI